MRGFIKTFTIFVYLLLALFIAPSNTFANENYTQNSPQKYFISAITPETKFINTKNEEYYIVLQSRNKSEILNPSNKNNNISLGGFSGLNNNNNILDNFISDNLIYPVCVSYNISPNLKNAIYTRAP